MALQFLFCFIFHWFRSIWIPFDIQTASRTCADIIFWSNFRNWCTILVYDHDEYLISSSFFFVVSSLLSVAIVVIIIVDKYCYCCSFSFSSWAILLLVVHTHKSIDKMPLYTIKLMVFNGHSPHWKVTFLYWVVRME